MSCMVTFASEQDVKKKKTNRERLFPIKSYEVHFQTFKWEAYFNHSFHCKMLITVKFTLIFVIMKKIVTYITLNIEMELSYFFNLRL